MRADQQTVAYELLGPRAAGDRIETSFDAGRLVIDVYSVNGIGRARILRPAGGWPESIVFRLHLAALEGFDVRGATDFTLPATLTPDADEPIEVALPTDLVDAGPAALDVQWVDRYR